MSFRDELERRSTRWVADGLITEEQRGLLVADAAREPERGAAPKLVTIFSLLGAVLVVLGVVSVVAQNWDEIPKLVKLAAGVTLMVAAYAAGYWLRFDRQMTKTGEGVLLIGSGLLLGNLALISQQYNIDFNPSPLFLPIVLVAVVSAYVLNSRAYAFVGAALAVIWMIFESQREDSLIEARNSGALLMVAGAGVWLMIASEANRRLGWTQFKEPVRMVGAVAIFAAVYILGFYRHFDHGDALDALPFVALIALPLAIAAAGFVVTLVANEDRFGWPRVEAEQRPPVVAAALALTVLLAWSALVALNPRGDAEEHFVAYTIGFWVLAVALTVDLGWLGLALRREWWINAALAYIGAFALARYFDLFGDYAQTGAVFAGAGLLLLVLAFVLERSRRALRDEISEAAR